MGNELREVGGEDFRAGKGAKISMDRGRGWVFGSSAKQFERPHPQLVHWWLPVHSNPIKCFPHNPI